MYKPQCGHKGHDSLDDLCISMSEMFVLEHMCRMSQEFSGV